MPILDWTRTDLRYVLADGGWALRFDADVFAAFDLFILARPGPRRITTTRRLCEPGRATTICRSKAANSSRGPSSPGCPFSEERYTLATLRAMLATYGDIDADALRWNLG